VKSLTDDPKIKEWLDHQTQNLEELGKSALFASIVTPNYLKSPECMLQLGAALCLGKPIVLVVFDRTDIPPKLAQIADKIIMASSENPSSAGVELEAYIKDFLE